MYCLLKPKAEQKESERNKEKAVMPPYFADLNLDQVVGRVAEDWGREVCELFYAFPEDQAEESYRRAIYGDVKKEEVYSILMEFRGGMAEWKRSALRREESADETQEQAWYLREAHAYVSALQSLVEKLEKAPLESDGMKGLLSYLSQHAQAKDYVDFCGEMHALWKELVGFRVLLTYEKERFTIAEGSGDGKYEKFLSECFPDHEKLFQSPFIASDDFSNLEEEILRLFRKKHKDFFGRLGQFFKKKFPFVHEGMERLITEMGYYLSFVKFQRKMEERGYAFCTPKVSDRLSAKGLYDLALALVSSEEGKAVVANDAYLAPGERFFVLTGPNQGGKTTYARSLGQLVYFSKMGLDAPAEFAEVPHYGYLWTHFSVEESAETGRGKLMDELVRLKPMMQKGQTNAFVVINELFTTAANYDANVMGKRVLEYFIGKDCEGIYVTHLCELANACDGVVSLRAGVDEHMMQTYRIQRSEAKELAYANRQVEKYRLTYEQLKERFS